MRAMRQFHKYHIWLGWLVGIPLLLWTASGLFMSAVPLETVRGEGLRAEHPGLGPITAVAPLLEGRAAESLTLQDIGGAPVWVIAYADGGRRRADAATGKLLPIVSAVEAAALARTARKGGGSVAAVRRTDKDDPPLDLRRPRPAWQIAFDDGARFYIDAESGELLAVRTDLWRIYDLMWGLHIMDLQTREDVNHPLLIVFAALSLAGVMIGCVLMFRRRKRRPVAAPARQAD